MQSAGCGHVGKAESWNCDLLTEEAEQLVTADCLDHQFREGLLQVAGELFSKPQGYLTTGQQNVDCLGMNDPSKVPLDAVSKAARQIVRCQSIQTCRRLIRVPLALDVLTDSWDVLNISENEIFRLIWNRFNESVTCEPCEAMVELRVLCCSLAFLVEYRM